MVRLAACWSPVCLSIGVITLGLLCGGCEVVGQSESDTVAKNLNVPLPTIGGAQLWTDLENRSGYRLQRNALSGHCRVLDPNNIRRGWGNEAEAMELLDNLCGDVPDPSAKPTAVLIHGLMRTDASMKSLEKALRADGYDHVIRFGYASTRSGLAESAAALRRVLEGQHPETEFCFVGHSMGNIVTRHMIGDLQRDGDPANLLPRCRAMVMLGPPNHGAVIARRLAATGIFGLVAGPGAMELGTGWADVESKLATPPFPFAIVAGKVEPGPIRNPLVEGDSDFVVGLEEAKLDGALETHEVPVLHSFLMNDTDCQKWTIDFLDSHAVR
ncbi:MAG: esterase/lipase family protein [Rhodopirellula sp. JB044]|uniref:esterase/lipase family protein n=1 Tax=Rhodopirellula sp. JB044 TaxID=3342844 RepID=UPI00370A93E3